MIIEYLGGPMDGQRDNIVPPWEDDPFFPPPAPPAFPEPGVIRYRSTGRRTRDDAAQIFEFVGFEDA